MLICRISNHQPAFSPHITETRMKSWFYLEPGVSHSFPHTEPAPHRHLQQVSNQTHRCEEKTNSPRFVILLHHKVLIINLPRPFRSLDEQCEFCVSPSREMRAHRCRGYMKEAFVICWVMSSSSLKGNVPLRLTYRITPTAHMSSDRL